MPQYLFDKIVLEAYVEYYRANPIYNMRRHLAEYYIPRNIRNIIIKKCSAK